MTQVDEALLSDPKTANGFDMFKQIIKSPKLNPAEWGDKIVRPYVDIIHNCGPNNTDTLQVSLPFYRHARMFRDNKTIWRTVSWSRPVAF